MLIKAAIAANLFLVCIIQCPAAGFFSVPDELKKEIDVISQHLLEQRVEKLDMTRIREVSQHENLFVRKYFFNKMQRNLSNPDIRKIFLSSAKEDKSNRIKAQVIDLLASSGEKSPAYEKILLESLQSDDVAIRASAAKAASSNRVNGSLPLIIKLLGQGTIDDKIYIMDILCSFGGELVEHKKNLESHYAGIQQSIEIQYKMLHGNKAALNSPHLAANRAKKRLEELKSIISDPVAQTQKNKGRVDYENNRSEISSPEISNGGTDQTADVQVQIGKKAEKNERKSLLWLWAGLIFGTLVMVVWYVRK